MSETLRRGLSGEPWTAVQERNVVLGAERQSQAIGQIPAGLLLISRLAMGGVVLFYVLTEPSRTGGAAPFWVGTAGVIATAILVLCAFAQWLTPEAYQKSRTVLALVEQVLLGR